MTCTTCSKAMDECHHYSDANFWRFASGRGYIIIIIIIIIIYSYKKLSDATNTTNSWWMRTRSHLADAEPPMCSAIYLVYFTHNAGFTYSFWRIRRACVVFLKYTILIACRKLLHYRLISRRFGRKENGCYAVCCVVVTESLCNVRKNNARILWTRSRTRTQNWKICIPHRSTL